MTCEICDETGWLQVAPVEDGDTLGREYVRNAYVGTFHPIPCFLCQSNVKVLIP